MPEPRQVVDLDKLAANGNEVFATSGTSPRRHSPARRKQVSFCFEVKLSSPAVGCATPWLCLQWPSRQLVWRSHKYVTSDVGSRAIVSMSLFAGDSDFQHIEDTLVEALEACERVSEAECLVTAPGPVPIFTCQAEDLHCSLTDALSPRQLDSFSENGLMVIKDAMPEGHLERWTAFITQRISACDDALKQRGIDSSDGSIFTFQEVAARGRQRFDLRIDLARADAAEAAELSHDVPWLTLVRALLGEKYRLWLSVVYSRPEADAQEWHADGGHIDCCAGFDGTGQARPYALCVFVPLIDLDNEVGFTQFWPGTHKYGNLLGFGPASEYLESTVNGIATAGSAVVYDYRTIHRGMPNVSNRERAVLQFFYHLETYSERRNYNGPSLLM